MMFFSRISGFDISNLEKLPAEDRRKIELYSLWAFLSSILCALSAAYLFKITTQSYAVSALSFATVLIAFITIQGLLSSNRAEHFGTQNLDEEEIKPKNFNIFIYLLLTILFTQPILIYVSHQIDQSKIAQINQLESNLRLQSLDEINNFTQSKLKIKLVQVRERINTLGGNLNNYLPPDDEKLAEKDQDSDKKIDLSQGNRKALVIGNLKYNFGGLRYTIKGASMMKDHLEKMGFEVTFVTDATREVMEYRIDEFAKSLNAGDISFFWFIGHGGQEKNIAYFIPIDDRNGNVSVNRIMQSISKRNALVSIIMADACRSNPYGEFESGFNSSGITKNTFIGLPASAGQFSWEGVEGPIGFFTGRLLNHIDENLDIQTIFDKVKEEVSTSRPQPPKPQNPTSISTLTAPITLSLKDLQNKPKEKLIEPKLIDPNRIGQCNLKSVNEDSKITKDEQILNCVSEYLKIKDDLTHEINLDDNAHEKLKLKLDEKFSDDKFNPIYFYRYIWSKQIIHLDNEDNTNEIEPMYRSLFISLFIWFVLAGGFIGRENLGVALMTYRRLRNQEDSVVLYSHLQNYALLAKESFNNFKNRLRKTIDSNALLNEKIDPTLPNPFKEELDIIERKNKYIRTGKEAIDDLYRALGK